MLTAAISGVTRPGDRQRHRERDCRRRPERGSAAPAGRPARPRRAGSSTGVRSRPWKTASAAVWLMSSAVAGDSDTVAAARAGASLSPSPTIRTLRPAATSRSQMRALAAGVTPARQCRMPSRRGRLGDGGLAVAGQELDRQAAAQPGRDHRRGIGAQAGRRSAKRTGAWPGRESQSSGRAALPSSFDRARPAAAAEAHLALGRGERQAAARHLRTPCADRHVGGGPTDGARERVSAGAGEAPRRAPAPPAA